MGRPIRMFEPDRLYFVTNRTLQGRLLLRPSAHVNQLVGGILARALHLFPQVELFAFVVMSNHIHLIARASGGALSAFMAYVEGNVARKVGHHHGWSGPFWHRRFSAEPILDDDVLLGRLMYIFGHGAKEGLVADPGEWPGLTCIPELVHGAARIFPWYDSTAAELARRRGEPSGEERFIQFHRLTLATLPGWETVADERRRRMCELLAQARASAAQARGGRPALGVDAVLAQDPHPAPVHVATLVQASKRGSWSWNVGFSLALRQQQTTHRDVLVEQVPVNAHAVADESPPAPVAVARVAEPGEPLERHGERTPILEVDSHRVFREIHGTRARCIRYPGTHAIAPGTSSRSFRRAREAAGVEVG